MLYSKIIKLACLLLVSTTAILISATESFSQETSIPYFVKSLQTAKSKANMPTPQTSFRSSTASIDWTQAVTPQSSKPGEARDILTAKKKMKYGFHQAFLNPGSYLFTFASAAITEANENDQPNKTTEDRVVDGFYRWARNMGTSATKGLLVNGALPVVFREDPRYFRSGRTGFGARTKYAISRVFVAQRDDGSLEPNYSRLIGSLAASGIANIWEHNTLDHTRIGVGPTFRRFGYSLGFDVVQFVVLKEFGPDIKKKFLHR